MNNKNNIINIDGKKIIGKISVLDTEEQIALIEGSTEENLKVGAILYENVIYLGDNGTAIILGYRETTFVFSGNIKIGDEIETIKSKNKFKLEKIYVVELDNPLILK